MVWIKKPKNIAIVVGAAVLAAVTIGLLIWGITTHREETLLETCWIGSVATFVEGEEIECTSGDLKEVRWDRSLIPVHVTPMDPQGNPLSPASDGYREIARAVQEVNTQFGYEHYVVSQRDTTLEFLWGVAFTPGGRNVEGFVEFRGANGLVNYAIVGVRDISSTRLAFKIAIHELGHAAGLAHDDFTASVMYPLTIDDTDGPMIQQFFMTPDVERLNELYNE